MMGLDFVINDGYAFFKNCIRFQSILRGFIFKNDSQWKTLYKFILI